MVWSGLQSGVPIPEQGIHYGDRELTDPKKTMQEYGIPDDTMLVLRRKGANVGGRYNDTIWFTTSFIDG